MGDTAKRRKSVRDNWVLEHKRPLGIGIVRERLAFIADYGKRNHVALMLAEVCYECHDIERLFRELVDCAPEDLDGIQTALINLEINLNHVRESLGPLRKELRFVADAVDRTIARAART